MNTPTSCLLWLRAGIIGLLFIASARSQSVAISFGAGVLHDVTSDTILPTGSLVLLIADTQQNGFGAFQSGSGLNVGSFLNGDDQILGRSFSDAGGEAIATFSPIPLASNPSPGEFLWLTPGDALALVWFNTLDEASTSLSVGDRYGLFSGSSPSDGDLWEIPSGGSNISINFLTESVGGDHAEIEATATYTVAAIPEPSTYAALFGASVLALAVWRRRSHR